MKKYIAEAVGTAILLFVGCGAIVLGGFGPSLATSPLGILPIGLAFGLAVTAAAYGIGPVSGAHLNPAVTVGMVVAGRMPASEAVGYIVGQVVGAFIGVGILALILASKVGGYDIGAAGIGQTTYDAAKGFGTAGAFIGETVATLIFVAVIIGATQKKSGTAVAGLVIGLTLAILHLVLVPVTGNSLNPARSLAPAVYAGGTALSEIWLYIVAPILGGAIAGLLFKSGLLSES